MRKMVIDYILNSTGAVLGHHLDVTSHVNLGGGRKIFILEVAEGIHYYEYRTSCICPHVNSW